MKQNITLLLTALLCMFGTSVWAQDTPVADLLDVQFNVDGTAVDLSASQMEIEFFGSGTVVSYHPSFSRNMASFDNPWGSKCKGYYKVDFENNEDFRNALADGHSLEMLVKASYEGAIVNQEAKPFSAMQSGGTGFLICKISGERQNEFTFLPNITTNGKSTWRWTNSGVVPRSEFYYHVIGVWNKEEEKSYIYVDGELKNTVDAPGELLFASSGCNWFCIGGDSDPNGGQQGWPGDVVLIRAYDKALTTEEATALWTAVKDQEWEANLNKFVETVNDGRMYLETIKATKSLIDTYKDALDALEALTESTTCTRADLEAQYDIVKALRAQVEASAAAYESYYTHVQEAITYLQENNTFDGDDRDYLEAYLNEDIDPNDDYPHGSFSYIWEQSTMTTEEITAETNWVDERLRLAIENGYKVGSDITNLLTNASFADGFNGWEGTVGTGVAQSPTNNYYGAEAKNRGFNMYQTLTGLDNGVYVLTASAAYRPYNDRYSTFYAANMYVNENRLFLPTVYETRIAEGDAVDGENCYLTQNGDDADVDLEILDSDGNLESYGINGKVSIANAANGKRAVNYLLANVTDGTLTIGFWNPNPNASNDWTGFANIHLLYAGTLEDADHYLDETLACMAARAQTIIGMTPSLDEDYIKFPNCPQTIKDKLQEAVNSIATTTTPEGKYALIELFTSLWSEYAEGVIAYLSMIEKAETAMDISGEIYQAGKLTQDEYNVIYEAYNDIWEIFKLGSYTTEEAINVPTLRALGLITDIDENGVYQIQNNFDMVYFARQAAVAGKAKNPINAKLLADVDYFTEKQMIEDFYGELDGGFHTITVNINRSARGAALINNMRDGASVKNMTIKGDVANSDKFATAVAANTYNMTTISGITSLIHVYSSTSGDAAHAGIMSCSRGSTTVKDCVFAGVMEGEGAINSSGIVGWTNGVTIIENCLQIGDIQLDPTGSRTIARVPESVFTSNTYYKTAFGAVDGEVQITDEQLASGEVCYMLNKGNTDNPTWFQTLGEDLFPVPDPSHQTVGKTAEGTYTNDASLFVPEAEQPEPTLASSLLLDVIFNEDGTAEDISPLHHEVESFGTPTTYWSETYQRYVASFDNNYGDNASHFYKAAPYDTDYAIRNALSTGHSFEALFMANYSETIPNKEAKPLSAMQSGGTGLMVTTISGERQNELTFLPNITTSGASTWRWTTSGIVPEPQVFYHVVGVWSPEDQKSYVYVNGELKNTIDAPGLFKLASSNCNWFCIGADPANATSAHNAWCGDVAIARVYSKPLNQEEVTTLWNEVLDAIYTGVEELPTESVIAFPGGIFNINGQRVEKTRQGIYIVNGKKILVK